MQFLKLRETGERITGAGELHTTRIQHHKLLQCRQVASCRFAHGHARASGVTESTQISQLSDATKRVLWVFEFMKFNLGDSTAQ